MLTGGGRGSRWERVGRCGLWVDGRAERWGVMRESLRESLMGYVTAGLGNPTDASIKGPARYVNRVAALKGGNFGRILGDLAVLRAAGAGRGGMAASGWMAVLWIWAGVGSAGGPAVGMVSSLGC